MKLMQSVEFFDIEGMTPRTVDTNGEMLSVDYLNDLQPKGMRIRVDLAGDGSALVKVVDSDGSFPGAEQVEFVPMAHYDPAIAERIVRALAFHHLDLKDVSTGYTSVDLKIINRGFSLGIEKGKNYGWSVMIGPFLYFLSRPDAAGIPASENGASEILCIAPDSRKVVFSSDDLITTLKAFDSGSLPGMFDPEKDDDVMIIGLSKPEDTVLH
ncbi:hypothetical protein [Roseibium sp. RKSG952]|uniref:hypothetical protein n=1 Tax=Roseibium sp. RKSG952 TaxID=2529384 RepID=UPI0012BC8D9F|nr:hypothetical protein [Roseibium sp. RKSG952]MTH95675.1 hypothetical protein [Roseibium sp. RKSG952]